MFLVVKIHNFIATSKVHYQTTCISAHCVAKSLLKPYSRFIPRVSIRFILRKKRFVSSSLYKMNRITIFFLNNIYTKTKSRRHKQNKVSDKYCTLLLVVVLLTYFLLFLYTCVGTIPADIIYASFLTKYYYIFFF